MNLNDYVKEVHRANKKWWLDLTKPCQACDGGKIQPVIRDECFYCAGFCYEQLEQRNVGELLMLCVSELAEAMESHRKNLQDDKLPELKMFEVEIVDCFIRLFDLCGGMGINLEKIYQEKMQFNANRQDHKLEARLQENGKKY